MYISQTLCEVRCERCACCECAVRNVNCEVGDILLCDCVRISCVRICVYGSHTV